MVTTSNRPPLSDGCPNVCTPTFFAIVPLRSQLSDDGHGVRSNYLCPKCGTAWWTAWNVETIYPEWTPAVRHLAMLNGRAAA